MEIYLKISHTTLLKFSENSFITDSCDHTYPHYLIRHNTDDNTYILRCGHLLTEEEAALIKLVYYKTIHKVDVYFNFVHYSIRPGGV